MMVVVPAPTGDIEDRDWVASRLAAGDTVAAIGLQAGVTRQTAGTWIKRHGLSANKRTHQRPSPAVLAADYERFGSIRSMATEYEISPAQMRVWLAEAQVEMSAPGTSGGRPRVVVDVAEATKLRADGLTWKQIATHLGVGYETVRRAVNNAASSEGSASTSRSH